MKAALLIFCLGLTACDKPVPRALTKEAYVWQRTPSEALDRALQKGDMLDGLHVLAAEVSFQGGGIQVQRSRLPWKSLAALQRPMGLVIRISKAEGGLGTGQVDAIRSLTESLLAEARSAGAVCGEVQIDYDCADSKIRSYAEFLEGLAKTMPEVPLAFTALPSWLDRHGFNRLAKSTGNYVLQVHSLRLPKANDSRAVLFERRAALKAIILAERHRIPFRVALPTYRCAVVFDAEGQKVAVVSETDPPVLEEGMKMVVGDSNPAELAGFVHDLEQRRSRWLTGILWYRLPVETDRMNWAWPTFVAVNAGQVPEARMEVSLAPQKQGYSRIEIRNRGDGPGIAPAEIVVSWEGGKLEAADGLGGYSLATDIQPKSCRLISTRDTELPPGETMIAGWVRLADPQSLSVTINANARPVSEMTP